MGKEAHKVDSTESCAWCGRFKCCFKQRTEQDGNVYCSAECADK